MRRSLLYFLSSILCLLVATSTMAQVANQNFNGLSSSTTTSASGYVPSPGDLTFTCTMGDGNHYMSVINGNDNNDFLFGSFGITKTPTNYSYLFNSTVDGSAQGSGSSTFGFHSSTSNPFKLVSMVVDASNFYGVGLGSNASFTFTGYKNGVAVTGASGTIDLGAPSTTNGSVTFTQNDGVTQYNWGTLTFDSKWQNIDEVRITGAGTDQVLAIDDLTFQPVITTSPTSLNTIRIGQSTNQTLTASGGTGPYTYAVTSGSIPTGLSLSSAGAITGTPTNAGAYSFTVTTTDALSNTSIQAYSGTVGAPMFGLNILPASTGPDDATVGVIYPGYTLSGSGGTAPYTFSIQSGSLPAGTTLSSAGVFSGTPTAGGSFTFVVKDVDSSTGTGAPFSGTRGYTWIVAAPTITLAPTTLTAATVGTAYSSSVTASGGTSTYTYAVTAGSLPAGLSLSTAGALTGTPTAGGTFNFTITATDSSTGTGPYTGSQAYTFTVNAPTITLAPTSPLPAGIVGSAYSQTITASGGTSTYTYAVTAGALPAGLTLASNGTLSGTPTAGGSFSFTITATDSSTGAGPYTGSQAYTLSVTSPLISVGPTTLGSIKVGMAYSNTLTGSGGTAPYTFTVSSGTLPTGLTLATDGTLSGTPTAGGSFGNIIIKATDSSTGTGPYNGTRGYINVTVAAPTITLTSTLAAATVGAAYSQSVTASGGTSTYTYAVTSGSLPAGLTLASDGTLSGTPTAGGTFNFTITATDSSTGTGPYTGSQAYTFTVNTPTITLAPASLTATRVGVAYTQSITASGGTSTYTYAVTAGTLPAGITLASDGTLSGTATEGGVFNITITATDSSTGTGAPYTGSQAYTLTMNSAIVNLNPTTTPVGAVAGVPYSQTISGVGGTAPYTFVIFNGVMPAGLTFDTNTGVISGTPTNVGSSGFAIRGTDSSTGTGPYSGSKAYGGFVVAAPTIVVGPGTLPDATVGAAYSQTITATGGTPAYTYAVTAGSLPAGLTLASATGIISGTPTAGGAFNFTITATDHTTGTGAPFTGSTAYTLNVNAPTITLAPASPLTAGTIATAYLTFITASGGTSGYTYAITSGSLPAGLVLASNGRINGTPTAGGTFNFTVTATDHSTGTGPFTGSQTYSLTINAPTITLSPTTLANASSVQNYSRTITATGGTSTYTYAVTAGALPTGITLSTAGTLSGTATQLGTFNFTITATDSSTGAGPYTGSQAYTLTVDPPILTISPSSFPAATVGTFYSQTLSTSRNITTGGEAYTYAVTAGTLPAGFTLSSAGFFSGTGTEGGTFNFTITSTDNRTGAGPYTASQAYTFTVGAPTLIINPPQQAMSASPVVPFSYTQTTSGGTAPYTYTITSGSLPAGITMASDGSFSGTATVLGTFNFTVTSTDSSTGTGPFSQTIARTLTVSGPIPTLVAPPLPAAQVGVPYSFTFTASGANNTPPYTFFRSSPAALPAGLTLAADGTLSGTPTRVGNSTFSISARDSSPSPGPYTGGRTYTLSITAPTIVVGPATIPSGTAGVAYSQAITATGGTAPYTYTVTAGALPAGVTLASDGTLSGTSNITGNFNFTVTATDATTGTGAPYSASTSYTLTMVAPTITLAPATLPAPTVGAAYSQTITASSGTAPYNYTLAAGVLPPGLALVNGTISGTPTAGGTFNFTVTATDGLGFTGSQVYTFTNNAATLVLAPATLPVGTTATAYSQNITASGGTTPYTYAVTAGTLPTGLTLATNGTISGMPTAAGTFNFTVTATDSSTGTGAPYTASTAYTITIGKANQTITFADITATYGDAPITLTGTASSGLGVTYTSSNTAVATVSGSTLTILSAGTATITASQAGNANYNAATDVAKTLTVNTKALTITATGPAKTYGTALTAGISTTNFTTGAAVSGQAVTSVTLTPDAAGLSATTAAGAAYTVTPSAATGTGGFVASNYNITYVPFTGTVGKATLDITANTTNKTYGQTLIGAGGSTAFTATGLLNSETIGSVTLAYGTGSAATAAVNTYTGQVTPSAATGGTFTAANYTIVYHAGDIVVGTANLTITATNKNKIYGDVLTNAIGSAEFTPAGLQNGETVGSVSLAYGTGAAANAAVGTYTGQITPSNAAGGTFNAGNYTIAYANGNIIVGAKAIAVTADAKTKVYGSADPVLTYQITSGSLVGTDVLTGALTRDAGEAVNTYAIKQGTLGASGNYAVTYTGANLTITKATLLAKATDQSKAYGAANPTFTVTYTGFANGDTEASLTTKPTVITTATATSPVGTYPLTIAGAASPNYTINYSPGTLTVTPAVLTATADNKSRNYGAPNPAFTVTYSGFVNGDDATKLTTAAVATNNSTATTAPGNYPITVSGASATNYTFNYVAGTLTIVPLTNTDLSSLTTSAGTLTPVFNTNTFTYNVTVDNATTTLSLTASFAATAKGTVNGTAIPNGSPSFAVPLNVGNNTITLVITAQDGVTKKTYTLTVYRGLAPINITATNILTPNGDGKNDYWIVKDIQLYPKNNVTVYDKGGRVVYTKVGYNNEWDGTLNGAPLVQGTYYYIVNLGPELPSFKGYISIVKATN